MLTDYNAQINGRTIKQARTLEHSDAAVKLFGKGVGTYFFYRTPLEDHLYYALVTQKGNFALKRVDGLLGGKKCYTIKDMHDKDLTVITLNQEVADIAMAQLSSRSKSWTRVLI